MKLTFPGAEALHIRLGDRASVPGSLSAECGAERSQQLRYFGYLGGRKQHVISNASDAQKARVLIAFIFTGCLADGRLAFELARGRFIVYVHDTHLDVLRTPLSAGVGRYKRSLSGGLQVRMAWLDSWRLTESHALDMHGQVLPCRLSRK